jgi:dUTP pyrophosphatase
VKEWAKVETGTAGVLSKQEIERLIQGTPALIAHMPEPHVQIQPNGVDITLDVVSTFDGPGTIAVSNNDRVLPGNRELAYDDDGFVHLAPGAYHARFNEVVALPDWLMAYARPRSSLLRSGVAMHTAVWDAGYAGRGASLLVVYHPEGFRLQKNARIAQLVFHTLTSATDAGYTGTYQHEGTPSVV